MQTSSHQAFLDLFHAELQQSAPAPERLALVIAGLGHATLDVDHHLGVLDQIADQIRDTFIALPYGKTRADYLIKVLHGDLGFTGDREFYYDVRNSFLNDVLERRMGLPIMLSLVYMAVGKRIGARVDGIGFPGHFMARYRDSEGEWLLDAFNGAILPLENAEEYLADLFQHPVRLPVTAYRSVTAAMFAQRMLNNVRNTYMKQRNYEMAVRVLDYAIVLTPLSPLPWQERGLLHYELRDWACASRDLRRYFFLTGQLAMALGIEDDQEELVEILDEEERQLLDIFTRVEEMQVRLN